MLTVGLNSKALRLSAFIILIMIKSFIVPLSHNARVERKTGVSQMVVFTLT